MEQVFLEASGTYSAKIDLRTLPPLIWKLCHFSLNIDNAITWGICLLNVFKGSVFWVSYLDATVLQMFMWFPFRPFDFLGGFSNRFTIAVMFGATSSTCLNMFLKPKNGIFRCLTQLDGWRVSGHTWINELNQWSVRCCCCFFCLSHS